MVAEFISDNRLLLISDISKEDKQKLRFRYISEDYNVRSGSLDKKAYIEFTKNRQAIMPSGFWYSLYKELGVNITNLNDFCNINLIDKSKFDAFVSDPTLANFTPHKHQLDSVYKGILFRMSRSYIDVSGGKTFAIYLMCRYALLNILQSGEKILVVVPKTDLVTQFKGDVEEYEVEEQQESNKLRIQEIYGGINLYKSDKKELYKRKSKGIDIVDKPNVYIALASTLHKYPDEFYSNVRVAIFDECHSLKSHVSQTQQTQIRKIYNNLPFDKIKVIKGYSGTMPEEGDHIAQMNKREKHELGTKYGSESLSTESILGGVVVTKSLMDLVADGSSSDFVIRQFVINIDDIDFAMAFYNDEDIINVQKRRYREMELLYALQGQEIILKQLLLKAKEENHLILFNTLDYLNSVKLFIESDEQLNSIFKVNVIIGGVSDSDRKDIKADMELNGSNITLATYKTMDTGTSIKRINNLHILDSCKRFYKVRQYIGRGVRLHETKSILKVYDYAYKVDKPLECLFGSYTNVIYKQAMARRKIYQFNKYKYKTMEINLSDIMKI